MNWYVPLGTEKSIEPVVEETMEFASMTDHWVPGLRPVSLNVTVESAESDEPAAATMNHSSSENPPITGFVFALEAANCGAETSTEGLVVGLGSPSGVVGRCPTCARILHDGVCRLHGAVTGIPDLRARILLDDGTGVATVHLPRDLTEQLTTETLAQLADRMRAGTSPLTIEEEFRRKLVGRRLRVTGRSRVDEFGLALFPSACREVHVDSNRAVDTLSRRLAGRPR